MPTDAPDDEPQQSTAEPAVEEMAADGGETAMADADALVEDEEVAGDPHAIAAE